MIDDEMIINMGPQHPSTHGVLYLELKLNGERVTACRPHLGYLHRGIEKIAENRTLVQFVPFTDRLDYLGSMNNNIGFCLAAETLLQIEAPPRAQYIRVIVAELNRIASHLLASPALTPFNKVYNNNGAAITIAICEIREKYEYFIL